MNHPMIYRSNAGRVAVRSAYDALLEKWPIPSQQRMVPTRLGDTFVLQCGDRSLPACLMLHGSSSNSAMWASYGKELSETYCVCCVDIPGEPGKSAERQAPLTDGSYVGWLDDVLERLGFKTAALVGISLGGWMEASYAVRYPKKVDKLVLLSPSGIGGQKVSFLLKALSLMLLGEKGREKIARSLYGDRTVSKEAIRYTTFLAEHFKPRTGKIPVFSDGDLKKLTMPLLCIVGEKDGILNSSQTAERIRRLLTNADMRVIPGAGHALTDVEEEVAAFLGAAK